MVGDFFNGWPEDGEPQTRSIVMSEPFHEANERLRERKRIENDKDAEIERLTALTKADAKEIGSYRDETGLRGEIKNKDAELDAADEKIERLTAELKQANAVVEAASLYRQSSSTARRIDLDKALAALETEQRVSDE